MSQHTSTIDKIVGCTGIKQNKDGTITTTFTIAGTNEIKYWVLSYGPHAEIKEPQSLRDGIKNDLTQALKRY